MKKGNVGMRNNSQAMTFTNFEDMPKIDTRELNNNSGLRQHENRSIQVSQKKTLPFGHSTVQDGFYSARTGPFNQNANTTQGSNFFKATKHSSDTYGEKQDPKETIQRMRLRINTAINKVDDGGHDANVKHNTNLKGFSRDAHAPFDSMTKSNALHAMLVKTKVPPSARNLNSIRSMHRQLQASKTPKAATPFVASTLN